MSDFEMLSIVLMMLKYHCNDFNCIYQSYKKVTAPSPKDTVTFL